MAQLQVIKKLVLAAAIALLGSGCSMMAPQYTASLDNVQTLRSAGDYTAKVGSFTAEDGSGNQNPLSIRGNSLASPYNGSYSEYVAEAIKQELSLAKKLSAESNTVITGTVLKNDIDASGISVGNVDISARFIVQRADQVRYDQVKTVRHEFPSSFAGAVAIPRAVQEYTIAVQKLLNSLYSDANFTSALKP